MDFQTGKFLGNLYILNIVLQITSSLFIYDR